MLHLLRKQIIIVLFLNCIAVSKAWAQPELNLPEHDYKKFYFGITLGFQNSYLHPSRNSKFITDDSVTLVDPQANLGLRFGLLATARLSEHWEARFNPSLVFSNKSFLYHLTYPTVDQTPVFKKDIESIVISFPVQLKFVSDRINNFKVYMLGGLKYEIDLASTANSRRADNFIKLKPFDFGVEYGLGFHFYFPAFILSPEIKFSNGLTDVHERNPSLNLSNVLDKLESRMITFSLNIEG
jgi:hypothetical protein